MSDVPAVPATSGGLALPGGYDIDGLEQFKTTDAAMPRFEINHKEGVFQDTLSQKRYTELTVVLLGLVRQRALWPPQMADAGVKQKPLCQSPDYLHGIPSDDFPFTSAPGIPVGATTIECEACPLKEWGSHPARDTPWCSEMYITPFLIPNEDGSLRPALITFTRSSLPPANKYFSSFATSGQSLYTCYTKLTLRRESKGSNEYSIPIFTAHIATGPEQYAEFSQHFAAIRTFMMRPRGGEKPAEATPAAAPAAPVAPVAAPVAPEPAPAPVAAPVAPVAAPAPPPVAAPAPAPVAVEAPVAAPVENANPALPEGEEPPF